MTNEELRDLLRAEMFDGDEQGTITIRVARLLDEIVDIINHSNDGIDDTSEAEPAEGMPEAILEGFETFIPAPAVLHSTDENAEIVKKEILVSVLDDDLLETAAMVITRLALEGAEIEKLSDDEIDEEIRAYRRERFLQRAADEARYQRAQSTYESLIKDYETRTHADGAVFTASPKTHQAYDDYGSNLGYRCTHPKGVWCSCKKEKNNAY